MWKTASATVILLITFLAVASAGTNLEKAVFAGGCFWCMEAPFDSLPGVVSVTPGYTGGHSKKPTYKEVSAGVTGHAEAVEIVYDPGRISYSALLAVFWRNIDPTVTDRQFCDTGSQYRAAIFFRGAVQQKEALLSREALKRNKPFRDPVVTEVVPAAQFFPAEEYHQHYYKKNPLRYAYYRNSCGRDKRLEELWRNSKSQ